LGLFSKVISLSFRYGVYVLAGKNALSGGRTCVSCTSAVEATGMHPLKCINVSSLRVQKWKELCYFCMDVILRLRKIYVAFQNPRFHNLANVKRVQIAAGFYPKRKVKSDNVRGML
jgi:hypothetical protein